MSSDWQRNRSRRFETRSAMAPANGVVTSIAMPIAKEKSPTELFLPVIS